MLGIVFKSIKYKESSELVYLYTENGYESILVKGANNDKKNLKAFCEPLTLVEFTKTNAKLPSLLEYEIKDYFLTIKDDYHKYKVALSLIELTRQIEDNRTQRIFGYLKASLEQLKIADANLIVFTFFVKMLKFFGILPNLDYHNELGFSFKLGGFTNSIKDELEFGLLLKEVYEKKEFIDIKITDETLFRLLRYYNESEAVNLHLINKLLGINYGKL